MLPSPSFMAGCSFPCFLIDYQVIQENSTSPPKKPALQNKFGLLHRWQLFAHVPMHRQVPNMVSLTSSEMLVAWPEGRLLDYTGLGYVSSSLLCPIDLIGFRLTAASAGPGLCAESIPPSSTATPHRSQLRHDETQGSGSAGP